MALKWKVKVMTLSISCKKWFKMLSFLFFRCLKGHICDTFYYTHIHLKGPPWWPSQDSITSVLLRRWKHSICVWTTWLVCELRLLNVWNSWWQRQLGSVSDLAAWVAALVSVLHADWPSCLLVGLWWAGESLMCSHWGSWTVSLQRGTPYLCHPLSCTFPLMYTVPYEVILSCMQEWYKQMTNYLLVEFHTQRKCHIWPGFRGI